MTDVFDITSSGHIELIITPENATLDLQVRHYFSQTPNKNKASGLDIGWAQHDWKPLQMPSIESEPIERFSHYAAEIDRSSFQV